MTCSLQSPFWLALWPFEHCLQVTGGVDDADDLYPAAGNEVEHDIGSKRPDGKGAQAGDDVIQPARTNPWLARQQVKGFFDHFQETIGRLRVSCGYVGCMFVDILGSPPPPDDIHRRFFDIERCSACRRLSQ